MKKFCYYENVICGAFDIHMIISFIQTEVVASPSFSAAGQQKHAKLDNFLEVPPISSYCVSFFKYFFESICTNTCYYLLYLFVDILKGVGRWVLLALVRTCSYFFYIMVLMNKQ